MHRLALVALALALVACDDGGSTEPGPDTTTTTAGTDASDADALPFDFSPPGAQAFADAPELSVDRIESWTPDPCPSGITTPEVFGSTELVLVNRAVFRGLGAGSTVDPADRVRHAGALSADDPASDIPSTWEPDLGPGECVGTTYVYFRGDEPVAGGRVIVVAE